MNLTEILLGSTPVVIGLIEVLKKIGLPSSWAPVAALVLGILSVMLLANIGSAHFVFNAQVVLFGIIAGLSSVGLYAGTTSTSTTVAGLFKPKPPVV